MSKGNTFETDLLALIFNGTAIANVADNAASSPLIGLVSYVLYGARYNGANPLAD